MTVREVMGDNKPNKSYKGQVQADDYILACGLGLEEDAKPLDYVVVQEAITEQAASLNPVTSEKKYLRAGSITTKTGTQRQFKISGDVHSGDPFIDGVLSHQIKYGTGQVVIVPYIFFNMLTGIGEKGCAAIIVESDGGGSAGDDAVFEATLHARGTPEEYEYEPENP